jgi:hypothetical protein
MAISHKTMRRFNALPNELQYMILDFTLEDTNPQVCFIWGPDEDSAHGAPVLPLRVDTGYPVAMHVCRTWRAYVLQRVVTWRSSPLRFRDSRRAGCRVPCRAFRPDMDVLYLGWSAVEHTARALRPSSGSHDNDDDDDDAGDDDDDDGNTDDGRDDYAHQLRAALAPVKHLAVCQCTCPEDVWLKWVPLVVFRGCRDVERVTFVHTPNRADDNLSPLSRLLIPGDYLSEFRVSRERHIQRCKLGSFLPKSEVVYANMVRAFKSSWLAPADGQRVTGEFKGSAWDPDEKKPRIEWESAIFFDYRRSNTGKEVWEVSSEETMRNFCLMELFAYSTAIMLRLQSRL